MWSCTGSVAPIRLLTLTFSHRHANQVSRNALTCRAYPLRKVIYKQPQLYSKCSRGYNSSTARGGKDTYGRRMGIASGSLLLLWLTFTESDTTANLWRRMALFSEPESSSSTHLITINDALASKPRGKFEGSDVEYYGELMARSWMAAKVAVSVILDYKFSWAKDLPPEQKSIIHARNARKLLRLCQTNGGIYIKLGQHVASLIYLVPKEYCDVLVVLQDQCKATPLSDIERLFQTDLGKGMNDLFAYFDPRPVGVASLAQVHRAVDHQGRECAVKVQHPALDIFTPMDIETVHFAVGMVKRHFPEFQLDWLAEEARDSLPKELDFILEADNARRTKALFARNTSVHIPEVYWATGRLLVMEYVSGCRIDQRETLLRRGIAPSAVSQALSSLYGEMIFLQGFIHCDPHPGNIFVINKYRSWVGRLLGYQNFQIVLLDHGLYRTISDDFRLNYAHLWISLIEGDEAGIMTYSYRLFAHQGHDGQVTHRLFASMLTGRSWAVIAGDQEDPEFEGVMMLETSSTTPVVLPPLTTSSAKRSQGLATLRTDTEMDQIQERIPEFLWRISDILARIPRPLLLLLKTNDLLRSVDGSLMAGSAHVLQRHLLQMTNIMGWYCAAAVGGWNWSLWTRLYGMWGMLRVLDVWDAICWRH